MLYYFFISYFVSKSSSHFVPNILQIISHFFQFLQYLVIITVTLTSLLHPSRGSSAREGAFIIRFRSSLSGLPNLPNLDKCCYCIVCPGKLSSVRNGIVNKIVQYSYSLLLEMDFEEILQTIMERSRIWSPQNKHLSVLQVGVFYVLKITTCLKKYKELNSWIVQHLFYFIFIYFSNFNT